MKVCHVILLAAIATGYIDAADEWTKVTPDVQKNGNTVGVGAVANFDVVQSLAASDGRNATDTESSSAKDTEWTQAWKYPSDSPPNATFLEKITLEVTYQTSIAFKANGQAEGTAQVSTSGQVNINASPDNAGDFVTLATFTAAGTEDDKANFELLIDWGDGKKQNPPPLKNKKDAFNAGSIKTPIKHDFAQNISNQGEKSVSVSITMKSDSSAQAVGFGTTGTCNNQIKIAKFELTKN
jgi:hypothetical protein